MRRAFNVLRLGCLLVGSGWLVVQAAANTDVPEMRLGVNRSRLFKGESLLLTVRVTGVRQTPEPDVSGIANAEIEFLGSQSQDRVSVTIIQGQVKKTGSFGRLFSYRITPQQAGDFKVGPIRVVLPDQILFEEGPVIAVQGVEAQDNVFVDIEVSRETVLVDEPFDVTLKILMKRMPGALADLDPLDPARPPHLDVPFLARQAMPGLDGPDVHEVLRARLVQQRNEPGFVINNYTVRQDPFDPAFRFDRHRDPSKARFTLDRRTVEHKGESYYEYAMTLTYRPQEEGAYTFGPVMFKGDIVRRLDAGRRMHTQSVFAVGPARVVRVVPPPEAGRPLSFIGAIGSELNVTAALDTQECKIGDPLTLTLAVSIDGYLRHVQPPPIHVQDEVRDRFRVYPETVETVRRDDSVRFLYRLRPIKTGTFDLPPLAVSYYDAQAREYRTVWTKPMPIRVEASPQVTAEAILGLRAHDDVARLMERTPLAPAPFMVSALGAAARPLQLTVRHGMGILGAAVVYGLVLVWQHHRRQAAGMVAHRRRRAALGQARVKLRAADEKTDRGARARALCEAMKGYLAQRLDVDAAGLTPSDAQRLLVQQGVDAALAAEFAAVMEEHFNVVYLGGSDEDRVPGTDSARTIDVLLGRADQALINQEKAS